MTRVLSLTTTDWRSFYRTQVAALEAAGVSVTTLEVPGDFRARKDGIERRTPVDYLRYLPRVLREVGDGYDVVHANYGLTAPFAALSSALPTTDLGFVCTLWGGEFLDNPYGRAIGPFAASADRVVVPSRAMADRIDLACDVIPFPVDAGLFRPIPRAEARERVGWDEDERIVLFPYAPTREEKNYPLARRVVDSLEMDATLRWVANQPYEDVPYYLNAADAVLIASRFESGPMTIKEAVACNVPVVSRDVGFAREVLEGVSNSRVVAADADLPEALDAVLAAGERADGRRRVAGYTTEEMGERLRAVYDECLA